MDPIVISEDCISRSRRNSSNSGSCCCWKRSNSMLSINTKSGSNKYEYVVEKLVIKRVPVKLAPRSDIALNARSINNSRRNDVKPLIFDSYCQLSPKKFAFNPKRRSNQSIPFDDIDEFENEQNLILPVPPSLASLKHNSQLNQNSNLNAKLTPKSARTIPLDNKDIATIHMSVNQNQKNKQKIEFNPNFCKTRSSTSFIDPAIKNTLEILARRRASDDYRIYKEPNSCRMRRQSIGETPLKLEDVYKDNGSNASMMRETIQQDDKHRHGKFLLEQIASDLHSSNKEVKWKIVIKQRKDKSFPHTFSSNLDYFTNPPSE